MRDPIWVVDHLHPRVHIHKHKHKHIHIRTHHARPDLGGRPAIIFLLTTSYFLRPTYAYRLLLTIHYGGRPRGQLPASYFLLPALTTTNYSHY